MHNIQYEKIIDNLLNDMEVTQAHLESLKNLVQHYSNMSDKQDLIGKKVELVFTTDEYTTLKPGDTGKISSIDDSGTVHVSWDNGSTLGLIPGIDYFTIGL